MYSVCIKCHTSRPLTSVLLILLPMFALTLFVIASSVVSSAFSLLYVLVLLIFFLDLVVDPVVAL